MDANAITEKILKELPYALVFRYPESKTPIPAISFFTLSEAVSLMADNKVLLKDVTVQIDVWAKNPKQCSDMNNEISSLMNGEGWIEIFAMDNEKKSEVFNRTIKYAKVFAVDE